MWVTLTWRFTDAESVVKTQLSGADCESDVLQLFGSSCW